LGYNYQTIKQIMDFQLFNGEKCSVAPCLDMKYLNVIWQIKCDNFQTPEAYLSKHIYIKYFPVIVVSLFHHKVPDN
jgi:hypothetical protein